MVFAFHRGEGAKVRTKFGRVVYALRLPFRATEYLALALYRFRVALKATHIPLLPTLINWSCAIAWGIRIGDPVVIQDGIYIPHGEIVIGGPALIGRGAVLFPWVTIGLLEGDIRAPRLEEGVFVGTGAKILGPVRVGVGARIGANAVVVTDVPPWATAVGAPARAIPRADTDGLNNDPESA
jgi:serine O-acetyltransferase